MQPLSYVTAFATVSLVAAGIAAASWYAAHLLAAGKVSPAAPAWVFIIVATIAILCTGLAGVFVVITVVSALSHR